MRKKSIWEKYGILGIPLCKYTHYAFKVGMAIGLATVILVRK